LILLILFVFLSEHGEGSTDHAMKNLAWERDVHSERFHSEASDVGSEGAAASPAVASAQSTEPVGKAPACARAAAFARNVVEQVDPFAEVRASLRLAGHGVTFASPAWHMQVQRDETAFRTSNIGMSLLLAAVVLAYSIWAFVA
jgi:hypothetical protein